MKNIFRHALAVTAIAACSTANAQNPASAYFMDGYAYGHQLNPAKDYDRDCYFSVPMLLGNVNLALRGNLGLNDIFFKNPDPTGKSLVTYLHPSLSREEALKGFSANNKLLSDFRFDVFSAGFHSKHAFQTLTIGIRANLGVNVPGELFELTRELTNRDYNFSNFGATAHVWGEVGWGYSRNLLRFIRVGGKLKVLVGGAYGQIMMDKLALDLSAEDKWTVTANATGEIGLKGFSWGELEEKEYSESYKKDYAMRHPGKPVPDTYKTINMDNADIKNPGVGGFGVAVDLGAELDMDKLGIAPGLKLSAAVLDLGFIHYNNVAVVRNNGVPFEFEGFNDIKIKDGDGTDIKDQADNLGDRLQDLVCLQPGENTSRNQALGATLNLGVEYSLPSYRQLALGLLSTTRIQGVYSWNEERLSLNYHPAKWLELGVNAGFGTLGTSFGWILNFHPRIFNFYVASDHMFGKLSRQMIPLTSNADIALGINFPLGKSRVSR